MSSTATDRSRQYRDRMRELGFTQVLLTVPKEQADAYKEMAAKLRAEHLAKLGLSDD